MTQKLKTMDVDDVDNDETDETIVAVDGDEESENKALVSTDRYPVIKLNNGRQVIAVGGRGG